MEYFFASLATGFLIALILTYNKYTALKKLSEQKTPTLTAEELLHDLTRGNALIRIERIAPESVFLRSPK